MKTAPTLFLVSFLCTAVFLSGCDDSPKVNFKLQPRYITITSEPTNARVTQINPLGQPPTQLGKTPLNETSVTVMTSVKFKNMPLNQSQALIKHVNNLVVKIEYDGHESFVGPLRTDPNEILTHHITLQPKPDQSTANMVVH